MSATTTDTAKLSAPRLITTTHTPSGKSIFGSDTSITPFFPFGPQGSSFARFHSRLSVPVSNTSSPPNLPPAVPRCPPNGIMFCVTDIPPGGVAPMHRTLTLDYVAVMKGEIVLKLDSDEETVIREGEFLVQRGTNHQWLNRGSEVCRMLVVMAAADKVVTEDGAVLEETVFQKKP